MTLMKTALKIHVSGIVQGVGFRPFVYKQAKHFLISGWVLNSADGVHIHAQGEENLVDKFCLSIANDAPPAAQIEQIEMKEVPLENFDTFEIKHSENKKTSQAGDLAGQTLVSPDLATCKDCVDELFDCNNKRYRYPFINCTNCGPRFTIIDKLPYDRCYTSMYKFKMCNTCEDEYTQVNDRRFHAQPNACFDCGPFINWIESKDFKRSKRVGFPGAEADPLGSLFIGDSLQNSNEIFSKCVEFLKSGKIVAIKGLGGYHLACDATNKTAVDLLRQRKMRSNKPFAIMAQNTDDVKKICHLNFSEKQLLEGSVRPIVLLKDKYTQILADNVAMGLPEIGVMLPYTPVQHILMNDYKLAGGTYLVMTSGNIYDNPIVIDDDFVMDILGDVADAILGNNRKILSRYDDSVVRIIDAAGTEAVQMIRRARGYAPAPIKIKFDENLHKTSFAVGPEQKNTFAFARPILNDKYSVDKNLSEKNNTSSTNNNSDKQLKYNTEVFVSQHIGDVENAEIFDTWQNTQSQYKKLFKFNVDSIACDLHPEYLTTKWAQNQKSCKVKSVQHHYAHIRSVMYENLLTGPVAGFAFDGTGYGADKNIWGGELLLCNTKDYERFANFVYVPMPGGQACIKHPLKMAYATLWTYDLLQHKQAKKIFKDYKTDEINNLNTMIEGAINTPMTSSIGRLFDAASALLGICSNPTYEGESAVLLEAELWKYLKTSDAQNQTFDNRYEIQVIKNVATDNSTAHDTSVVLLDAKNTFGALLDDLDNGLEKGLIAKNFHDAFVQIIVSCSQLINQIYEIKQIALSGGVFMNRYLIENSIQKLINHGFSVALNKEVPPNDGGISLGQI